MVNWPVEGIVQLCIEALVWSEVWLMNSLTQGVTEMSAYVNKKKQIAIFNAIFSVAANLHCTLHCIEDKNQHCACVFLLYKSFLTRSLGISQVCLKLCMWTINSQKFKSINCVGAEIFTTKSVSFLTVRFAIFTFQTLCWLRCSLNLASDWPVTVSHCDWERKIGFPVDNDWQVLVGSSSSQVTQPMNAHVNFQLRWFWFMTP